MPPMASLFLRDDTWWVQYYDRGKRRRESLNTTSKARAKREKVALEHFSVEMLYNRTNETILLRPWVLPFPALGEWLGTTLLRCVLS